MPMNPLERRQGKRSMFHALSYRLPIPVVEVVVFRNGDSYCVCPRCDSLLDREYIKFCDRCGQCLAWELFSHAKVITWPRKNPY